MTRARVPTSLVPISLAMVGLALTMAIALAACGGSDERPRIADGPAATAPPVTDAALGYPVSSDPDTPIYVAPGQRFGVARQAESSAGYRWKLAEPPDPTVLAALGNEFRTTSDGVGAPQVQVLTFVATGLGTTRISLQAVSAGGLAAPGQAAAEFEVISTADGQPPPTTTTVDTAPVTTT